MSVSGSRRAGWRLARVGCAIVQLRPGGSASPAVIGATMDQSIDNFVDELDGLSAEEITLVESRW